MCGSVNPSRVTMQNETRSHFKLCLNANVILKTYILSVHHFQQYFFYRFGLVIGLLIYLA